MKLKQNLTKSLLPRSEPNLRGTTCIDFPFHVNSKGLWVKLNDPHWWLNNSLPLLELQLILFCFALVFAHHFLKRFGFSKISSQILMGLAIGCSWNQWDDAKSKLFGVGSQNVLVLLTDFGYALYLFLSAAKIDVTMSVKTGKSSLLIGIPAVIAPLLIEGLVRNGLYGDTHLTRKQRTALPVLMGFHGMTSFPVVASLVSELQIVNSELGRLSLSSALVSDIFGVLIMIAIGQANRFNNNPSKASAELSCLLLLFLLAVFVFRPAMRWIIKQTPEGAPVKSSYIQLVIFLALLSTVLASFTGQSPIIGPFIFGLAVPDGAPLASTLVDKLETLVSDMFMPILITTCALRVDFSKISAATFHNGFTKMNIIIICAAVGIKFVTCVVSSKYCKFSFKDALTISLIVGCKGSVELVSYRIVRDYDGIDDGLYGTCIICILIIATFVPAAVRCLYDPSTKYAGFQNRNIMHLNPSSDQLRLLACIHRNENITAILHLLNVSCPTPVSPLTVHIFHLIELPGRTAPILISHKQQDDPLDNHSYSRHIINSFDRFERDNEGTVYIECFTAVSPCTVMHDEVCTLALDKIASLIILPFHITWTVDGFIDQDDQKIRKLNYSVLEKAPCSVGIFVDRGNLGRFRAMVSSSEMICSCSVCVIFVGGKDDREAISYAKRMVSNSRVRLTVLRLRAPMEDQNGSKSRQTWEDRVDGEVVKDFKSKCLGDERVVYLENVCRDGQETAFILRKIADRFDLIIVGRRNGLQSPQTAGLDEWNEFPELGLLGDLIASTDINTRASLLVMQQQQIR